MRFDNLAPLAPSDRMLGLALMRFGRMIEDGVAIVPEQPHGWPRAHFRRPDSSLRSMYAAFNEKQALDSLWRAGRQYTKGNLTAEEFAEIDRRCNLVLSVKPD